MAQLKSTVVAGDLSVTGSLNLASTDPHTVLIGPNSGTAAAAPAWRAMSYQDTHGIEYIRGTWTAASGTWTGVSTDAELYDGKQIILYMPFSGSGNATLNLTLAGGDTTGAKNVYFESTTRFTTHKGQNAQLHLIYHKAQKLSNGTTYEGWWYVANRDTDNDYRTRQNVLADTDDDDRSLLLANPVHGTANNNTAYITYRNDKIYANVSTGTVTATQFKQTGTSAWSFQLDGTGWTEQTSAITASGIAAGDYTCNKSNSNIPASTEADLIMGLALNNTADARAEAGAIGLRLYEVTSGGVCKFTATAVPTNTINVVIKALV